MNCRCTELHVHGCVRASVQFALLSLQKYRIARAEGVQSCNPRVFICTCKLSINEVTFSFNSNVPSGFTMFKN